MKLNYTKIALFILCLLTTVSFARVQSPKVNLIYIGDSITAGAGINNSSGYPPVVTDSLLRKMGLNVAGSSNQGHSGYTTLDFLPNTDAFKKVEDTANNLKGNGGMLVFSIMLGTNDSAVQGPHGSPVTKEQYYENLKTIISQLLKDYPSAIVIIHRQTWYSPNTYNGAKYLQEGLDRLKSYYPEIKKLVDLYGKTGNGKVYLGDTEAFNYFSKNYLTNFQPENGHQGTIYLHPNNTGAAVLAGFWSKAIYNAINKH